MPDIRESLQQALAERYAIEGELGHGATATVFLARDLKHKRAVAVKVLSPEVALAVRTERFLREIEIAAQLSHPHIVPLFDSGSESGFLYYVMPYIQGESLRDLLARGGPLPVEEALRIARQVAGALDHAHRAGVIHRDIKPGNILLEEGHARVADFGIARAVTTEDSQLVTETGVTIGTPAYMSPEQASGETNLDRRSDIYSLGCVLYEMLAGRPPFTGLNVQTVLTKHLIEPTPRLRDIRSDVSEEVQGLVELALAKNRDDRFGTAAEFAEALALQGAGPLTPTRTQPVRLRRRLRVPRWAGAGIAAAGVVAAVFTLWRWAFGVPRLDPTAYFVAPFARAAAVPASLDAGRLLQDAMNEWTGIRVLGGFEAPAAAGAIDAARARELALDQRAGHYIRGEVAPVGSSLRVRAALYATSDGSLLRERQIDLALSAAGTDSLFAALADRVLFDDTVVAANGGVAGTRSASARQEFARGLAAVQAWELLDADSAFRRASDLDPGNAQAHLWLAQVRFWGGSPAAAWQSSAERAAAWRERLSAHHRPLSDALLALGRGEIVMACRDWHLLTQRKSSDFAAWYGLANCLSRDNVVLPDRSSSSGWRFRTSYHQTTRAYRRAFQLLPSIHRSLRGRSYEFVRRVLMTSGAPVRWGVALPPDTTRFGAHPVLERDTLALVPFPRHEFARRGVDATKLRQAVHRERELFREVATAWLTAFPRSPDAMEALALSLDMLGNPAAIDTLRRARSLAVAPEEQARIATVEVWALVKFSVPLDVPGLRAARALADSLLETSDGGSSPDPLLLASLAALTGRAAAAAALTRRPAVVAEWGMPGPLARAAGPLLIFAAFAGPTDSLRDLEDEVVAAIEGLPASMQAGARMRWLARPASLAFPEHRFASLPRLEGGGDYDVDAQAAFLRGDTATVVGILTEVSAVRAHFSPADVSPDALLPEASLLANLGDRAGAIAWLDPSLRALPLSEIQTLLDPPNSAALVRAMALRAELARAVGDARTAARWARVAATLWSDADPFLQPRVREWERLAKEGP